MTEDELDTPDTVSMDKMPQNEMERRPGESEADFSLRMAQIQRERLQRRKAEETDAIAKATRVWGS